MRPHRRTLEAPVPGPLSRVRPVDHGDQSEHSARSNDGSEVVSDQCAEMLRRSLKADSAYGKRMLKVESGKK